MNTEHFMTCLRAYFPDAPVTITNNGNGNIQTVTLTHDQLFPHKFVITNDVDNNKVLLYVNGLIYPRSIYSTNPMMSEKDLLHTVKLLNLSGWRPVKKKIIHGKDQMIMPTDMSGGKV